MKLRGVGRVTRLLSRIRTRLGPKAVVLLYHRVADLDSDPWGLAVSPANFAEQLDVLRARDCVVPVGDIATALQSDPRALSRKVAITFDDGYTDNLFAAKPLLEQRQLPATIFMTSGTVGRAREFWWDELERIFLQPGALPEQLALQVDGQRHEWTLQTPEYGRAAFAAHGGWRADGEDRPTERQELYRSVYDLVQGLAKGSREAVMDTLTEWAGVPQEVRASHRALSPEETRALADSEWIEIGAHTVAHQALSTQSPAVQEEQIRGSKEQLEALCGSEVRHFSYPYGLHTDETVAIVRRSGFASACACLDQVVRRTSDPFRIPRLVVGDWPGHVFAAHLDRWLHS